ncbi:MAG: arylsulfotransferase family protein [Thermoanaerobaculia bacterium]
MQSPGWTKRFAALALLALALAGPFYWGFQTHRKHWFPYWQLRRAFQFAKPGDDVRERFPLARPRVSVLSLPYIQGAHDPNIEKAGVLRWERERASPGTSLFNSTGQKEVQLIDLSGRTLHRWRYPKDLSIGLAVALPTGELLALQDNVALFKLDREGMELWRFPEPVHHSIEVDDRGHIWTITRRHQAPVDAASKRGIIEDFLVELTPDGEAVQRISLLETLARSPYAGLVPTFLAGSEDPAPRGDAEFLDLIHPNHVEVFDGSLQNASPLYAKGNLLVSLRNMHAIAILDGASHEVLWFWGPGYLFSQHHSTLLESGNILVFNNGVERSSIVEVDPRTNQVSWEYAPEAGFFSRTMGSCQRLPNGNTLITDSESGRAFEVTSAGQIVWSFANPDRQRVLYPERDLELRSVIYRLERYPPGYFEFLERR